jgi:hypothetical protein
MFGIVASEGGLVDPDVDRNEQALRAPISNSWKPMSTGRS